MAKTKWRTRYRKAKTYTRRRARNPGFKGLIKPVGAGVAVGVLNKVIPPIWGIQGIPATAVGWFMKDNTLQTIGGLQIGQSIANNFLGGGGTGGVEFE